MRLARLGSFHPTRLSFVRSLVRRMGRERWIFRQRCHDLDASGFGRIVYEIETPAGLLTFLRLLQRTGPGGAHRPGHRREMGHRLRAFRGPYRRGRHRAPQPGGAAAGGGALRRR